MTDEKDDRPDPFAPLPLASSLLPAKPEASRPIVTPVVPPVPAPLIDTVPAPVPPEVDAARPLPPTAFTSRVTGDHDVPAIAPEREPLFVPEPDLPVPPLAATHVENELRDAVGATLLDEPVKKEKKKKKRAPSEDGGIGDDDRPRSRKAMLVAAASLVVGGGITAFVLLGRVNSARFALACEADRVVVLQGRSFPPWGESPLAGAEWKALKIPPEASCVPRETEDKAELAGWYGKMLVDQAETLLTAREVSKVDEAEADLKQALLVARSLGTDNAQKDSREYIERLLGDVAYWRASARLRSASDALAEAAKQFDAASLQKPRYATDAAAWALHIRSIVDHLQLGPKGVDAAFPPLPPSERPPAPTGVALPVEPDAGSGSAAVPVEPAAIDAGVPTGGVLL